MMTGTTPRRQQTNAHLAERAVPEWQASLDALQELPEIGGEGLVGYYGPNMGTAIGVPLTAVEPRITASQRITMRSRNVLISACM